MVCLPGVFCVQQSSMAEGWLAHSSPTGAPLRHLLPFRVQRCEHEPPFLPPEWTCTQGLSFNKANTFFTAFSRTFFSETGIFFEFYFIFLYSRFLLVIYFIHISIYMSIPISQFIPPPPTTPPPPLPPWCPYVCSLHLCLYFCLANRFTCTIFLDSTYMR